jgi:heme A synthase
LIVILERRGMPWYSIILAGVGSVLLACFDPLDGLSDSDLRSAASMMAQISATLAGFLLTVLAVLATIVHTRLLRNMQKTGHFRFLLRCIFVNAGVFGVVVAIGMITVLWNHPRTYMVLILAFFALLGLFLLVGVFRKLWVVFSYLHTDSTSQE